MFVTKDFTQPEKMLIQMETLPKDEPITVEISRDGLPVVRVEQGDKKLYLGSKYSAAGDVQQVVAEAAEMLPNSTVIVFGLGNGEYIKKITPTFLNNNLLVILEPNLEVIRAFLAGSGVRRIKRGDPVILYHVSEEDLPAISRHIQQDSNRSIKFIVHPGYTRAYPQLVKSAAAMVVESQKSIILEDNTWDLFVYDWVDNPIRNIRYIPSAYPLNDFVETQKGCPAVIVSAGPSLSKNIHLLEKVKEQFVIISGGRPLRPLLDLNIHPDFVCIIDAGKASFNLVDGVLPKADTTLIHYDRIPADIFEQYQGRHVFYTDNPAYDKIFGRPIGNMITGTTVAHASVFAALNMGCNPIIFIGQDLAFTDDRNHAGLTSFDFDKQDQKKLVEADDNVWVEDIHGGQVKTSHLYNQFRQTIEEIITQNPGTTFINATQGGANIKGTAVMDLDEAIRLYENAPVKNLDFENHEKIGHQEEFEDYKRGLLKKYQDMGKEIEGAFDYSDKLLIAESAGNSAGMYKHSKRLNKLENKMSRLVSEDSMLQSLVASSFKKIKRNNELLLTGRETVREAALKGYERRSELYSAYKVASAYLVKMLKKELGLWTEEDERLDQEQAQMPQGGAAPLSLVESMNIAGMSAALKDALKDWEEIANGNDQSR
ncbi:6-hydroxymethylpterin diphosphokinase MptE-like protein [Oscillospiraceae bacterium MB08-C2-2]|nr:6-hydroxymethylpterin diphosphokinase MptE-like protein [Oscillospiraceae bacterium MB08-C2-2]